MDSVSSLNHSVWDCKYHVVFIPKCRRKKLFGALRKELGEVFRHLAARKESRIEEGHLMPDHVHMLIAIPPKFAVAQVIGFIKGKSAIYIARNYIGAEAEFYGATLLGARLLRIDRGPRRGGDPRVHQATRSRGSTRGTTSVPVANQAATVRWLLGR